MPVSKKVGIGIVLVQLICTIVFIVSLLKLGMLPTTYCAVIVAMLALFLAAIAVIQMKAKKKAIISKGISILISAVLIFAAFYIFKTGNAVASISSSENVKVDKVVVAVLADDPAETINDAAD